MSDAVWAPIPGADGYEASSNGRLRSIPRHVSYTARKPRFFPGKELTPQLVNHYNRVHLTMDGRRRLVGVHVLVCLAFNGPRPSSDHEVRHLNGDKLDNRALNLAWGTKSENAHDAVKHGVHPMSRKTHCPKNHPYSDENTELRNGERFCIACRREAQRAYYHSVGKIRRRERNRAARVSGVGVQEAHQTEAQK